MTDQEIEAIVETVFSQEGNSGGLIRACGVVLAERVRDRMQAENRSPESLLSENEIDRGIQEQLLKEIFGSFPSCEKDVLVNTLLTSTKECVHAVKQADKLRDELTRTKQMLEAADRYIEHLTLVSDERPDDLSYYSYYANGCKLHSEYKKLKQENV